MCFVCCGTNEFKLFMNKLERLFDKEFDYWGFTYYWTKNWIFNYSDTSWVTPFITIVWAIEHIDKHLANKVFDWNLDFCVWKDSSISFYNFINLANKVFACKRQWELYWFYWVKDWKKKSGDETRWKLVSPWEWIRLLTNMLKEEDIKEEEVQEESLQEVVNKAIVKKYEKQEPLSFNYQKLSFSLKFK